MQMSISVHHDSVVSTSPHHPKAETHEVVAMIVPFLFPYSYLYLIMPSHTRSLEELVRMQLVQEIIRGTLLLHQPHLIRANE